MKFCLPTFLTVKAVSRGGGGNQYHIQKVGDCQKDNLFSIWGGFQLWRMLYHAKTKTKAKARTKTKQK